MWVNGVGRAAADVDPRLREAVSRVNRGLLERQRAFTVEPTALDPPALGRLGEIAVPALVITGAHDQPSVIAGSAALADGLPHAEAVEIADTAHLPSLERPDELEAAILPFLERRAG